MTVVSAETIRASVTFEDLIEPLARAFQECSAGLADNGLVVMFPAERRDLGDVYVKTGSIRGHDVFIVRCRPGSAPTSKAGSRKADSSRSSTATRGEHAQCSTGSVRSPPW